MSPLHGYSLGKTRKAWAIVADHLGPSFRLTRSWFGLRLTGTIDGYEVRIDVMAIGERPGGRFAMGEEGGIRETRFRVRVDGLPEGLSISPHSRLSGLGLFRRRYVTFGDPRWDDRYRVKARDHDEAIAYLSRARRGRLRQIHGPAWWVITGGRSVKTAINETELSAHRVESTARLLIEVAKVLDPVR